MRRLLHHRAVKATEASANTVTAAGRGRGRSKERRSDRSSDRDGGADRDASTKRSPRSNSRGSHKSRDRSCSRGGKGDLNRKTSTMAKTQGTNAREKESSSAHCKSEGRPKRFWGSHSSDECKFHLGEGEWAAADISRDTESDDSYPAIIEEVTAIGELTYASPEQELTHDSGATVYIFRDNSLLRDLKRMNQPVRVKGLFGTPRYGMKVSTRPSVEYSIMIVVPATSSHGDEYVPLEPPAGPTTKTSFVGPAPIKFIN